MSLCTLIIKTSQIFPKPYIWHDKIVMIVIISVVNRKFLIIELMKFDY